MNLIAIPAPLLQVHDVLPFDVVDAGGRMLMPLGTPIDDVRQLERLRAAGPMADAEQSDAWRAERERAASGRLPAADDDIDAAGLGERPLLEEVRELPQRLAPLLRNAPLVLDWSRRIERLAARVRADVARDADSLLYLLVQRAARYHDNYSTEHALLCAVVCTMCAEQLRHGEDETRALVCAALTMNASMTALQDELAQRERTPTLAQRRAIDEHAADGARLLRRMGITDELWIETVALHHRNPDPEVAHADLPPGARLAGVLHRVDVFTAKISARRSRAGLPAPLAARDACLGPDGLPDTIGAATVKALSIYPPGSYVRLANSETAVVVRRGERADRPQVVSLLAPSGRPLPAPQLRDTALPRHEIRAAVRANEVRVAVNHEQVLALAGC